MKIGPIDRGDRPIRPEDEESRRNDLIPEPQRRVDDVDRVEISQDAWELSQQAAAPNSEADCPEEIEETGLRRERIEQARQRAASGYYDSPDVREEIAKRIANNFLR